MKIHLILPLTLSLASCGVLRPVDDSAIHHVLEPQVRERPLTLSSPSIAINRPALPSYLDREQLVTRSNGQLMVSNLDLWGEPLGAAVSRVTASNLSRLTGSMNIQPVENFVTLDYTWLLEIRISRFEPDDSGQIVLEGTWKLQPVKGGEATNHYFRINTPVAGTPATVSARVAAMNLALESLARSIANKT